ncbi:MAG: CRTAC1 family protein [Nannocystales bacterium]
MRLSLTALIALAAGCSDVAQVELPSEPDGASSQTTVGDPSSDAESGDDGMVLATTSTSGIGTDGSGEASGMGVASSSSGSGSPTPLSTGTTTNTESTGSGMEAPVTYAEVSLSVGIDVAHESIDLFATEGQAWGDYDGDGVLDLVVTSQLAPNHLFRGTGSGSFDAIAWPVAGMELTATASTGAVFVDFDNDTLPDLYLLAFGENTMLRNDGAGGFTDVSLASGLADVGHGETAAWGDYDGDGLLDVYVANNEITLPDRLLHNDGGGSFSEMPGVLDITTRTRLAFSASFFDYDLDGDVDLYVVNDKAGGNVLWRNDGPGCGHWCFTDVSASSGAGLEMGSMGLAVGDYDNDGDQDVFISDLGPMKLLNNQAAQGQPVFVEVAEQAGALVDEELWNQYGWGAQFIDYDNDGWLDLYVAIGQLNFGAARPNVMLRNMHDGTFLRLPDAAGAEDTRRSQGLAIADYDEDGWVDILVGNAADSFALFHNEGGGASWLEIELRGDGETVSTDAVGARVSVTDDTGRTQTREVICGSSLGAGSMLRLHFGFGDASPTSMTIRWPDGSTETTYDVPVNILHSIDF